MDQAQIAAPDVASRRVFAEWQCHHRDPETQQPDCELPRLKSANLCKAHEIVWQIGAKARREFRIKTGTPAPNARRTASAAGFVQLELPVAEEPETTPPTEETPPEVETPKAKRSK